MLMLMADGWLLGLEFVFGIKHSEDCILDRRIVLD